MQKWLFEHQEDGSYLVVLSYDGAMNLGLKYCLDIKGGLAKENALIILKPCNADPTNTSQRWVMNHTEDRMLETNTLTTKPSINYPTPMRIDITQTGKPTLMLTADLKQPPNLDIIH